MKELNEAFLEKYPKNGKIIELFERGTSCKMVWANVTKANLNAFSDFLSSEVASTSAKTYCAYLKSVLNLYSDQVELPRGWEKTLSIRSEPSEHIYLDENEISRIIAYVPTTYGQAIVQQQFVISCLTGARHSDAMRMNIDNIVGDRITYVSQKTKTKAIVPLSPIIKMLMEEGVLSSAYPREFAFAFRDSVSDTAYNEILRNMALSCGIDGKVKIFAKGGYKTSAKYELIASHCGRRSFCTNLYLRSKDLYLVSKLAGHSSIDMTMRYICAPIDEVPTSVMEYFNFFR